MLATGIPSAAGEGSNQSRPGSPSFRNLDDLLGEVARQIPTFGGSYLNDEGGLTIWMTQTDQRSVQQVVQALDPLYDLPLADLPVRTRAATFRFGDLKRWHDLIRAHIRDAVPGVVFSGFDERHNRLGLGLTDLAARPQAEAELERLQVPLEAVLIQQSAPVVPQSSLTSLHRPLVGGLQIQFSAGTCTHGFTANRSGRTGFVTNSHCSTTMAQMDGGSYGQPTLGSPVGSEIADPSFFVGGACPPNRLCRHSDANFVERPSSVEGRRQIARPSLGSTSWDGSSVYRVTEKATGSPSVDQRLFKVGRTTGRTRGDVKQTCYDTDMGNYILLCQVWVQAVTGESPISSGGDSGSPWFRIMDTPQTHDVRLMGIHWGGTTDGTWAIYSKMAQVEGELGALEVCFSGFTC